jgi:hypothetical protein
MFTPLNVYTPIVGCGSVGENGKPLICPYERTVTMGVFQWTKGLSNITTINQKSNTAYKTVNLTTFALEWTRQKPPKVHSKVGNRVWMDPV